MLRGVELSLLAVVGGGAIVFRGGIGEVVGVDVLR